jgi:hypothetical protein
MQQGIEAVQRKQLELQERAQEAELDLRRLALDRADENEKAAEARLARADQARIAFVRRGQTVAIWLAAGAAVPLLIAGLICMFLAVAGVGNTAVDLTAGSILLAGGLFAGIANLIGRFLPPQ